MIEISAEEFRPSVNGQSDFFSWQLYRWLKKNPYCIHVFLGKWDNITGYDPDKKVLYIGVRDDEGCFVGNQLRRICTQGHDLQSFAYQSANMRVEEWEDHTEEFWKAYTEIGVCAIHGDGAHDWVVNGNTRRCKHCGKVEKEVTKMIPQKVWEAVQASI